MIVCDYDELVKALREHAEWMGPNNYELPISMYDDLLKAADAIEELQKAICPHYIRNVRDKGDDSLCNKFICEDSKQPSQQWISVEERLPENELETYWVCTSIGSQHSCRWTNNRFGLRVSDKWGWSVFDIPQYTVVTHWMNLPEPPKESTNDSR